MARWRKDFKKAPDRCLGWCKFPAGEEVRIIHRSPYVPGAWSAYGSIQEVVAWQPIPAIPPADRQVTKDIEASQS
jgi:hypothetical protein